MLPLTVERAVPYGEIASLQRDISAVSIGVFVNFNSFWLRVDDTSCSRRVPYGDLSSFCPLSATS